MTTTKVGDGERKAKMYIRTAAAFPLMRFARFFRAAAAISTIFLLAAVAVPAPAGATPPSAVDLSFDKATGTLNARITHDTADVTTHYIYKVEITKNGTAYDTFTYTSQPDPHQFNYTYHVIAGDGDTIAVTASCIWYGYLTTTLNVSTGKTSSVAGGSSSYTLWPYHAAMMAAGVALGTLAVSAIYMKKKPWWFRAHKLIAAGAVALLLAGVSLAAYMIAAAGGTQFRVLHSWVGLAAIILELFVLALGMLFIYTGNRMRSIRPPHIWTGRVTICLMLLNIVLGLSLVGLLVLG